MADDKIKDESAGEVGLVARVQKNHADGDIEKQIPEGGEGTTKTARPMSVDAKQSAFKSLGLLDRFLAIWILLAMVIGVVLGNFVPNIATALEQGEFAGVCVPIGAWLFSPRGA